MDKPKFRVVDARKPHLRRYAVALPNGVDVVIWPQNGHTVVVYDRTKVSSSLDVDPATDPIASVSFEVRPVPEDH